MNRILHITFFPCAFFMAVLAQTVCTRAVFAQEGQKQQNATAAPAPVPEDAEQARKKKPLPPLPEKLAAIIQQATALNPDATVLIDVKEKQVVLRTEVACRDCVLEMLLVPEQNREHETILRIRAKAYVIHTALLALGLEPGSPATFSPEFKAPTGPEISIEAVWVDEKDQVQRVPAQNWIRHNIHRYYTAPLPGPPPGLELPYKDLRWDKFNNEILWFGPMTKEDRDDLLSKWKNEDYRKAIQSFFERSQSRPMEASFVFAGSSIYKDEETGIEYYQAEGGHLICTSNFGDSLLDVREKSSADDGSQTYEGWTERIPPEGTPVLLILKAAAAQAPLSAPDETNPPADKKQNR